MMRLTGFMLLCLLALTLVGCGGGGGSNSNPGGNPGVTISSVNLVIPSGTPTVLVGQTAQLSAVARDANGNPVNVPAANFTYTSDNLGVATVSTTGLLTGISKGSANITVRESSTGKTATGLITVDVANTTIASVTLNIPSGTPTVLVGQTAQLSAVAKDANGNPVNVPAANFSYTSSNTAVATVGGTTGLLTGVSKGSATITVRESSSGITDSKTVSVDVGSSITPLPPNTIVFTSDRNGAQIGNSHTSDVYTLNLNTLAVTRITNNGGGVFSNINGAPSPDGRAVAFVSGRADVGNQPENIWVVNADGSGAHDVSNSAFKDHDPSYSPDGSKIVFSSNRNDPGGVSGGHYEIYIMNADGSSQTRLTNTSAVDTSFEPSFSLDGKRIVFSFFHNSNLDIYTMKPDGTDLRRLTTDPAFDRFPSFSPDSAGSYIAFQSERFGNAQLFTVNADGTNERRVTSDAFTDAVPIFASDGSHLIYQSNATGTFQLYMLDLNNIGSTPVRLTNNSANDQFPHIRR
jgi:Tol biopolymer transport system component